MSSASAPDGGPRRPWWASPPAGASDGAAASGDRPHAPDTASQDGDHGGGDAHEHVHVDACQVCPVCSFLRVAGEVRPDLVHHLAEAARQVTLAAKAVLDAQARGWDRHTGLQHVPLDEE
ncbi:MAG: hypothetical protein KY469_03400 [Actinobacteria bacterium]|nr:hypothetical protein [Actinomycetota bacterium]